MGRITMRLASCQPLSRDLEHLGKENVSDPSSLSLALWAHTQLLKSWVPAATKLA